MGVPGGLFDPNRWPRERGGGLRGGLREPGIRYLLIVIALIVLGVVAAIVVDRL